MGEHAERLDAMTERANGLRRRSRVVAEVLRERRRQDEEYPGQVLDPPSDFKLIHWMHVGLGQAEDARRAGDVGRMREEAVGVCALALKMVEIVDARGEAS